MGFCAPAAAPFSSARWASLLAFSAKEHLRPDGSLPDPDAGGGTGYLSATWGLSVSYGNMPHSDQTYAITARGLDAVDGDTPVAQRPRRVVLKAPDRESGVGHGYHSSLAVRG